MHLKAIIPLLMLSTIFILSSTAFLIERKTITTVDWTADTGSFSPITAGPYSLFANNIQKPLYAFNADSHSASIIDVVPPNNYTYTVVDNELVIFSSGSLAADWIIVFNTTSQQTSTENVALSNYNYAITAVGKKVYFAGGFSLSSPATVTDYVGIYDTTTQSLTSSTLPMPRVELTATSVGDFALFAGGRSDSAGPFENDVFIFNTATQSWSTASLSAPRKLQVVSIGQFAIFVGGNLADIFDSNTQTWTTHTLSQAPTSVYGFSITKDQRYVFFVGAGRADVFDAQSQTWSTLEISPSTPATYCPSTIVDNYALFACGDSIAVYNTATQSFVRRIAFDIYDNVMLQAGSIGKVATFLCVEPEDARRLYVMTFDFTTGPPHNTPVSRVINPSPVTVQLSTHQIAAPRPLYYVVANKAIFTTFDNNSVDIYDADSDSWSTSFPDIPTRGAILTVTDDFLVFSDSAEAVLHIFNANSLVWSKAYFPEGVARYFTSVGNYLFYSGSNNTLVVYDIVNDTWLSFSDQHWLSTEFINALSYKNYAVFVQQLTMTTSAPAWDIDTMTRTDFYYGGDVPRRYPAYAVAGDYLVFGGGLLDDGSKNYSTYSADFSIQNPHTGEHYSGLMPSERYTLNILYVHPLVMYIGGLVIESFNVETQQWQTSFLDVGYTDERMMTGHWMFTTLGSPNYVIEFDSTTLAWTNITFAGSAVGKIAKLGDLAAFVDKTSLVLFNPHSQQWTRAQFSSDKQFARAFTVGDKALIMSSDARTMHVIPLSQLSNTPAPTPSNSVPWSPWMPPVTTNSPSSPTAGPTSAPSASTTPSYPSTPSTQAPLSSAPALGSSPSSSSSPVASSTSGVSSPVTVEAPTNGGNLKTSSASLSTTAVISIVLAVILV